MSGTDEEPKAPAVDAVPARAKDAGPPASRPTASVLARQSIRRLAASLQRAATRAGSYAVSDTVRVGVTGLAGSGKTVFITALVQNLLLAKGRRELLPFFGPAAQDRIVDVRIEEPGGPAFPLSTNVAALKAATREWPRSTTGVSHVRLAVTYRARGALARRISDTARLAIEITDYPGEWLLDIGLIGRSFREWSIDQIAAAARPPRNTLAQEWLAAAEAHDLAGDADPAAIDRIADAYQRYLAACRRQPPGLSLLQPGRYLCPGEDGAAVAVPRFFPSVRPDGAKPGPRSIHAELERRFDRYRQAIVEPFYRDHFRRFDRQVVLVDVLTALNAGPEAFFDMQAALRETMLNFRYARESWLRRLMGGRIGTVVFAATKADHVTANQYHNLRMLLSRMVEGTADVVQRQGATAHYVALASIKSTANATRELDGRPVSVLRGVIKGESARRDVFPGEIPADIPERAYWTPDHFRFFDFMPPKLDAGLGDWFRHVHLDQVLRDLLQERLR